jgi:hypothetical protein
VSFRALKSPVLVCADRVLVSQPPERLQPIIMRVVFELLPRAVRIRDQPTARPIELTEVGTLAPNEGTQLVEQLGRKRVSARDGLGLVQELERALQIRLSQAGHDSAKDTTIFV